VLQLISNPEDAGAVLPRNFRLSPNYRALKPQGTVLIINLHIHRPKNPRFRLLRNIAPVPEIWTDYSAKIIKINKPAILPLALYGCEIRSLILRREYELGIS
jgi:hypothetical protein